MGVCRVVFISLVLISFFSSNYGTANITTELEEIKSSADFPEELADAMTSIAFPSFFSGLKAATTGINFIKSIISLVDVVLKITGTTESPELREIKKIHKEMTKRFDSIDLQLQDLKIQMKWSEFVSQFGYIEQDIDANYVRMQNIFLRPLSVKESEKNNFIAAFKITCITCAMKLYQGIMGEDRLLIGDILRKAEPLLKYDRAKMQTLMTGLFQLLTKSVSEELLYDKLVYGDVYYDIYKTEWFDKIQNVTSRMALVDTEVKDVWYDQASSYTDQFAVQYSSQSNQLFSSTLYNFLKKRFYWRDWLVIVYKPIREAKNHNNFVCDGFKKYRLHGRNIVVASVDATREAINTTVALDSIQDTHTIVSRTPIP